MSDGLTKAYEIVFKGADQIDGGNDGFRPYRLIARAAVMNIARQQSAGDARRFVLKLAEELMSL